MRHIVSQGNLEDPQQLKCKWMYIYNLKTRKEYGLTYKRDSCQSMRKRCPRTNDM